MFPRPFDSLSRYSHRYYQGLKGYYLPATHPPIQRGEPPRLVPEPSVFVLQVANLLRFSRDECGNAPDILAKIARNQGDPLHHAYWQYASPDSERMTFETARMYGFTPEPPGYARA